MKNEYLIQGGVCVIDLGSGIKTVIDASDFELVAAFPNTWLAVWFPCTKSFYCDGFAYQSRTNRPRVRLHRVITGCPKGAHVDHINHDTLDNRRKNLRVLLPSENPQNRIGPNCNCKSGVLGVYWEKERGVWRAKVGRKYIGRFSDLTEAEAAVRSARAKIMPFSIEALEEMKHG